MKICHICFIPWFRGLFNCKGYLFKCSIYDHINFMGVSNGRYRNPVFTNLTCQLILYMIIMDLETAGASNWGARKAIVDLKPSNGYSQNLTWLLKVHQLKSHYTTRIFSLFISCSIGCWSSKDFSVICDKSNRKWNYPSWKNIQVILFEIECVIFYTNLHELFCQFISWTNWVNSGKFMDNCWISCQVMAGMKKSLRRSHNY